MATNKKYFQDHFILLLLSTNIFLAFSTVVIMLARLSDGRTGSVITQYRPTLGIGEYQRGSVTELLSFIVFALLVATVHTVLSQRIYQIHRHLAIVVLGLGILLLLLGIIVSNALLALR
jgi:hypothetical protein